MNHPNAAAAATSAWVVAALLYLADLLGWSAPDPPIEVAVGIGGSLSALVLFIGRNGLSGLAARVWRGQG